MELCNRFLQISLDKSGQIETMNDIINNRSLSFKENSITVETDLITFCSYGKEADEIVCPDKNNLEFHFTLPSAKLQVRYVLAPQAQFIQRYITVVPKCPLVLFNIACNMEFEKEPLTIIDYHTFWNCPTAVFVRENDYGMYTGFANPFFQVTNRHSNLRMEFAANMKLCPGEVYDSESNFFGMHGLYGGMIEQEVPQTAIKYNNKNHPRYRNPSGDVPLYRSEIRSFKQFADDYLELRVKDFKFIFYNFFSPLPEQPDTQKEEELYYHYIDNFVKMGGDIITFNPLTRNRIPIPTNDSYWELAPHGSRAQRILNYAKDKGLKVGFYMGSAQNNANYCNSPMTEFAAITEKPQWKKVGCNGEISRENCIADDDFAEWFYQVQRNTIEKYGLTLWDWDPGPGNGFFCYSNKHGHVPGLGNYKGFRNAMRIVTRLKDEFPDLYIQGFHGTKEYGLWGFKGFDQHEAYWEQCPYDDATLYPDLSEDRLTASGMRFQSWWNQNFRFMPAITNHSLIHRMTQDCMKPQELLYLFDHLGWKYGVMSGLAAGASITVPMIPFEPDDIYGDYIAFIKKWVAWGKENFEYNKHAVAFGSQVVCGGVDGYSKIIGSYGFIFLCNPAPVHSEIRFTLGDEIGLSAEGNYVLKELYPRQNVFYYDAAGNKGIFEKDDSITVVVPPYEVLLLELSANQSADPILYGINGEATVEGDDVTIIESEALSGDFYKGYICLPGSKRIRNLLINGIEISAEYSSGVNTFTINYGYDTYERYLYNWQLEKGESFPVPNNAAKKDVTVHASFYASGKIKTLLQEAKPRNAVQEAEFINKLRIELGRDNFAWATPHHLFLVIPFSDAAYVSTPKVLVNQIECKITSVKLTHYEKTRNLIHYIDITDLVHWEKQNDIRLTIDELPARQFLGAYLYYPPAPKTDVVQKAAEIPLPPIINTRLDVITSEYTGKGGLIPIVNNAWLDRPFIEEYSPFTVCADINLEPDNLEGVYLEAQIGIDDTGQTLGSDEMMEYDCKQKIWKKTLHMGSRQYLIIDCKQIHIWAVAKDGTVSRDFPLNIEWKLY